MSQHAKRIVDERKDKANEAAKLQFAEAIQAAAEYPDAGFNAMRRQYLERYGEHYYQTLESEGARKMKTQQELLRQVEAALRFYANAEYGFYPPNDIASKEFYDDDGDRAKEALPAIDELLRMSAWQTIESAPLDTAVLVYPNAHDTVTVGRMVGNGECWDMINDAVEIEPKIWRLMPQPDEGKL